MAVYLNAKSGFLFRNDVPVIPSGWNAVLPMELASRQTAFERWADCPSAPASVNPKTPMTMG